MHNCDTRPQLQEWAFTSNTECRGSSYSTTNIARRSSGSDPCYFDNNNYEYFTISCAQPNAAWQVIRSYTYQTVDTCTESDLARVRVYYSNNCVPAGCTWGNGYNDYYECLTSEPDPLSYFPNAYVTRYYSGGDCSGTPSTWTAYNPECSVDTINDRGIFYTCKSGDNSVRKVSADETCQLTSFSSTAIDSGYWVSDNCYYQTSSGLYYSVTCGVSNPAYNIIEQRTINTNDKSIPGDLLSVYSMWDDYCHSTYDEFTGYITNSYCSTSAMTPSDFFLHQPQILANFYSGNDCNAVDLDGWGAFSIDCGYNYPTDTSAYYVCDSHFGNLQLMDCTGAYCLPETCSVDADILTNLVKPTNAGCFFDENIGEFYTLNCGAAGQNMSWQVVTLSESSVCSSDYPVYQSALLGQFCHETHCGPYYDGYNFEPWYIKENCQTHKNFTVEGGVGIYLYTDVDMCEDNSLYAFTFYGPGCTLNTMVDMEYYDVSCDPEARTATVKFDCRDEECGSCQDVTTVQLNKCVNGAVYVCASASVAPLLAFVVALLVLLLAH
eukprot:TRINITY_DN510_c0_g1_i8.p1 TRINITY_DN510_c0_g1~~TRINITY_DN510_c0_g1_i8.p1  ORF type:complete len:550 (-),score=107.75 TRINITY_DN510_c0_g1_i8:109-1758(-)